MFSTTIILITNVFLPIYFVHLAVIDLGGSNVWNFYSRASSNNISGKAVQVPGDIYADLQAIKFIEDPLFGDRDQEYRWVARQKWTYERTFQVSDNLTKAKIVLLHLEGLDSMAQVEVNGQFALSTYNQFLSYVVDLKNYLTAGQNSIKIDFESPVGQAEKLKDNYLALHLHKLPPECTAEVQNGECGVQFLRKIQASFSWDWGPAFPTVGIWKPVFLEYFLDQPFSIVNFSPLVLPKKDSFMIQTSVQLTCSTNFSGLIPVNILVDELELSQETLVSIKNCNNSIPTNVKVELEVARSSLQLWFPRGYGAQPLYTLTLSITTTDKKEIGKKSKKIGFRTVELVQDLVDEKMPKSGRNFYFKVNGIPVFLKGTNWIPISPFPARNHTLRRQFLLESMAKANLNSVRVWGGGMYETPDFYALADKLGLLIWHDLMFACALYPTEQPFLDSVKLEVEQQVSRLRHHPSILVWAGNNENEVAIASGWWYEQRYSKEDMVVDYKKLYFQTLKPLVNSLDASRPFLLSSPSNGLETDKQSGYSDNPGDTAYGDIHFYDDFSNLWKDSTYKIPRCATEYGIQSYPLTDTMTAWINQSEWNYGSKSMNLRQHHAGGALNNLVLVYQHFDLPAVCGVTASSQLLTCQEFISSSSYMDDFSLLSQLHQAVAMQVESEHYRRWRSHLDANGQGNTMCAMYWQLNDVWAAPSWSSIDYNLSWKMLHYFARRFFAPLIVSMYLDKQEILQLYIVSDLSTALPNTTLSLQAFVMGGGFKPIYSTNQSLPSIPAQSSVQIQLDSQIINSINQSPDDFLIRATLSHSDTFPAILLPDKLYDRHRFGQVQVVGLKMLSSTTYLVELEASNIVPVVWLDLSPRVKSQAVLFYFYDNAFAIVEKRGAAVLQVFDNPNKVQIGVEDFIVRVL